MPGVALPNGGTLYGEEGSTGLVPIPTSGEEGDVLTAGADGTYGWGPGASFEDWRYVGDPGEPSFLNSWGNVPTLPKLSFRKSIIAGVEFVDIAGAATGGASGTNPFTLPVGYRPNNPAEFIFLVTDGASGSLTVCQVAVNGDVPVIYSTGLVIAIFAQASIPLDAPVIAS